MKKQLPKNWVECTLGEIAEWGSGGTPSRGISEYYNGTIPWLKTGDLNDELITKVNEYITELGLKNSSAKLFPKDSVVIAMYGATIGKTGILGFDSTTNQACAVAIPYLNMNKFLFLLLKSEKDNFIEKGKGGAQPNISQAVIKSHKFLLPPLAEQNRIVAKLDTLFTQLEIIKTSMAKIPVLLKEFRQQVLTQAVTGKLTEEWRKGKELEDSKELLNKIKGYYSSNKRWKEVNNVSDNYLDIPSIWQKSFIGNIAEVSNGSTPSRKEASFWNGHIPWIGSAFIQNNRISFVNEFITDEGFINSSVRLLPKGTVLIAMIGEGKTRAQSAILDLEATINQNIAAMNIDHGFVKSEFLQYYLISNYDKHRSIGNGTGPQALNCQKVRELEFVLPPFEEQQEIVSRVESLFVKADAIEQQYLSVKEKIDNLPQALLHKAFKGELTEQLESDGDARELLLQIQELKNSTVQPKKATSKKVKKYPENETVLRMVAEGK